MAHKGTNSSSVQSPTVTSGPPHKSSSTHNNRDLPSQITKADLDSSLTKIYEKLVDKIQCELQKTTNTLTQEIATPGRTHRRSRNQT